MRDDFIFKKHDRVCFRYDFPDFDIKRGDRGIIQACYVDEDKGKYYTLKMERPFYYFGANRHALDAHEKEIALLILFDPSKVITKDDIFHGIDWMRDMRAETLWKEMIG